MAAWANAGTWVMGSRLGRRCLGRATGVAAGSSGVALALRACRLRLDALDGQASPRPHSRQHRPVDGGWRDRCDNRGISRHCHGFIHRALEPAGNRLCSGSTRLAAPRASPPIRLCRPLRGHAVEPELLGTPEPHLGCRVGVAGTLSLPEHGTPLRRSTHHCGGAVIWSDPRPRLDA